MDCPVEHVTQVLDGCAVCGAEGRILNARLLVESIHRLGPVITGSIDLVRD